jgi:hypothetical protein
MHSFMFLDISVKMCNYTFLFSLIMDQIVCLFSWRYNPLRVYFPSPVAGFSLLVFEVS